jgi:hypothetical protein
MGNRVLATQLQLVDQLAIPGAINRPQIIQESPATADKLKKALARPIVLAMQLEMSGELIDAFGNERDLNRRTPGIGGMLLELLDRSFLRFFG